MSPVLENERTDRSRRRVSASLVYYQRPDQGPRLLRTSCMNLVVRKVKDYISLKSTKHVGVRHLLPPLYVLAATSVVNSRMTGFPPSSDLIAEASEHGVMTGARLVLFTDSIRPRCSFLEPAGAGIPEPQFSSSLNPHVRPCVNLAFNI